MGEFVKLSSSENGLALFGYAQDYKVSGYMLKIAEDQYVNSTLAQIERFWDGYFAELNKINAAKE